MNIRDLWFPFLSFLLAHAILRASIPFAKKVGWVDHPSSRRRHLHPMPMVGGISVMAAWYLSCAIYFSLHPQLWTNLAWSFSWIAGGAGVLCALGLYDDLRGLSPRVKLPVEFLVAAVVIAAVPEIREFCLGWQARIGWLAWPLAGVWLVGVSNAMNLVDGLDGLAGGISAFILASIAILAVGANQGILSLLVSALLLPAVLAFLAKNWSPASVFFGDNGSLPIGFLIGLTSLAGPVSTASFSEVFGLLMMLGYPILDMGLCTLRRLRSRNPIFKADRGHLHHRLLRMNLPPARVVTLILGLTLYLQTSAFLVIELARSESFRVGFSLPIAVTLLLVIVAAGICVPVYFLKLLEMSRTGSLAASFGDNSSRPASLKLGFQPCLVAKVNLEPLFQCGLWEEKGRIVEIMRSLNLVVESILTKGDNYFIKNSEMHIFFEGRVHARERIATKALLMGKLQDFQNLFALQYSNSYLNVDWEVQEVLAEGEAGTESNYLFQLAHADAHGANTNQTAV
ncbi:MAG: glycosyltransferase family 4 protein [Bacteriovoracia bacterium]